MTVYCKTEKGQSEIQTRAHRLPPRLRQALILVDGKRDDSALGSMIPGESSSVIDSLLSEGFIAVVGIAAPASTRPTAEAPPAPKTPSLETLRRDVVRALTDTVGPAGEGMAIRIEKSKSMAELGPAIGQAVQLVRAYRGEQAANAFAARFVA
jgi:hypothetical protein